MIEVRYNAEVCEQLLSRKADYKREDQRYEMETMLL